MEKRLVLALALCFGVFILSTVLFPPPKRPEAPEDETAQGTDEAPAKGTAGAADAPAPDAGPEPRVEPALPVADGLPEHPVDDAIELETENLLLAFTTRGAALRQAWLKNYEIRPGLEPDRRENWYRILREDLTQYTEKGRDYRKPVLTGAMRLLPGKGDTSPPLAIDSVSWRVAEKDVAGGRIVFSLDLPNGLTFRKTWTVTGGGDRYDVRLEIHVVHAGTARMPVGTPVRLSIRGPVGLVPDVGDGSRVAEASVTGYYGHGEHEIDIAEVRAGSGLDVNGADGASLENPWAGLGNLFFASVLVPDPSTAATGVSIWSTRSSEAVAAIEDAIGRRLATSELEVLGVVAPKSCLSCSGRRPKSDTELALDEELRAVRGVGLTPKEYAALGKTSLATCIRLSFEVPEANEVRPVFAGMLFLGPKEKRILDDERYAMIKDIRSTGWLWWVAEPLLWILRALYGLVGNYGVAIILLTIIVRGCMFPLSRHQQVSMQKYSRDMGKLKPKLDALKQKNKDNPKKMNQEMMKLYKSEGVSMVPKGCLVMFLQIPIFIGLFSALRTAIELRHAPFLWVADLTGPDRLFHMPFFENVPLLPEYFNLFPITMTILWWLSAKMAPKPVDPQQQQTAKMMQYMPLIFGVMLYKYQAGLAIYMTISSLWSIVETRMVRRMLAKQDKDDGFRPVIQK